MFEALEERRIQRLRDTVGVLAACAFNSNPMRGENSRWAKPTDFFPDSHKKQDGMQTPEEQAEILSKVLGVGPGRKELIN